MQIHRKILWIWRNGTDLRGSVINASMVAVKWRQAVIAAALLHAAPVTAAIDPICADRPGKASATCTAPAGHVQIESGLSDWIRDHGHTTLTIGATAIK